MSGYVNSAVSFDSQGSFTTGRKTIKLNKKNQPQQQQQSQSNDNGEEDQNQNRPRKKDRLRINLRNQRPIHQHVSAMDAAAGSGDGGDEDEVVDLSLASGTNYRRRQVEVRTKSKREAALNAARYESLQASQASGFDTRGGSRRALIVLPKNEEKMKARETLMQMHPHIAQLFRGLNPPDQFPDQPFNRILTEDAQTLPYRRRNMEVKTVVQWGERKLFLYELEFLTQYGLRPNTVVVYANCAPATRLPFLASLFPHLQFVLVDPTILDFDETTTPNIQVKQFAFSDQIAKEIATAAQAEGKTLLFIANATTESPTGYVTGGSDEDYVSDSKEFSMAAMTDQAKWHLILNPAKSLLKFSLPWSNDSTRYLDGDIILPVWNPPTSTETRLIPNGAERTWSHRHYEEQMFAFNTITRVSLHSHGVTAEGLDGCFDCASEVFILERYLERYPHMLQVAVGSQLDVIPQASEPATSLKLDSTKFKDPAWIEKQQKKQQAFLITFSNDENDGQPLTAEQIETANQQFLIQQQQQQQPTEQKSDENMSMEENTSMDTAAAAASSSSSGGDGSMVDASPTVELSPLEQLKLNVGKFSQELSRKLTHDGTRTLATLNDKVIKRAAFSRKNRG